MTLKLKNQIRTLPLFVFSFLICHQPSSGISQSHTFKNQAGKEIVAEIMKIQGDQVVLLKDRRKFVVPINSLSLDDQEYVKEWGMLNRDFAFSFTAKFVQEANLNHDLDTADRWKQGIRTRVAEGGESRKNNPVPTGSWKYETSIQNRSGVNLPELSVHYMVCVRLDGHTDGKFSSIELERQTFSGHTNIGPIGAGESVSISTPTILLNQYQWTNVNHVSSGPQFNTPGVLGGSDMKRVTYDNLDKEVIDGIWIKIFLRKREIASWKSSGETIDSLHYIFSDEFEDLASADEQALTKSQVSEALKQNRDRARAEEDMEKQQEISRLLAPLSYQLTGFF